MIQIIPHKPTEENIKHLAYELWGLHGKPVGRDQEFWDDAKNYLEAQYRFHETRMKLIPKYAKF